MSDKKLLILFSEFKQASTRVSRLLSWPILPDKTDPISPKAEVRLPIAPDGIWESVLGRIFNVIEYLSSWNRKNMMPNTVNNMVFKTSNFLRFFLNPK